MSMGDWREALRPFLRENKPEDKLRADLRTRFNLSDERIDKLGGPVRVSQLFFVVARALELARSKTPGRKPFGWAVREAAKLEAVELTEKEDGFVLLSIARMTMALAGEP